MNEPYICLIRRRPSCGAVGSVCLLFPPDAKTRSSPWARSGRDTGISVSVFASSHANSCNVEVLPLDVCTYDLYGTTKTVRIDQQSLTVMMIYVTHIGTWALLA